MCRLRSFRRDRGDFPAQTNGCEIIYEAKNPLDPVLFHTALNTCIFGANP